MPDYLDCDFHVCDRERAGVGIEERGEGDAKREHIVGHGAVFYNENDPGTEFRLGKRIRERVGRNAFDAALIRRDDTRALFNHSDDFLLARVSSGTLTLGIDAKGLTYSFPYDPADIDHKSVRSKIMRGDLTGSSFGFVIEKESFEDVDDSIVRTIESVNPLIDVSPVSFPAYPSADSGIGRRKHEHFERACFAFIGQHRDDAGVRQVERRAAAEFGWKVPTEFAPGKPREWYLRQMHILVLENKLRFAGK